MSHDHLTPTLRARREPEFWRSLAERLDTADFREEAVGEFGPGVDQPPDGFSRRRFLQLMGASMTLAGIGACSRAPDERILPYNVQPPEVTPGVAQRYATAMTLDGFATGVLVEAHEGRPTKVEGNPDHPASLGASGAYEQAWLLGLYDPQRAKRIRERGTPRSRDDLAAAWAAGRRDSPLSAGGDGVALLLEPTASPLLAELLARFRARYPAARVYFHAPLRNAPAEVAIADFGAAERVVALDSNFLASGPFSLRYAHDFAIRRRVASPATMNRLYVAEPMPTPTGTLADHRLRVRASEVGALAQALLAAVRGEAVADPWVRAAAADLRAHAGRCGVVAGERQPAAVHAAVRLCNAALGNVGSTVRYVSSPLVDAGGSNHSLLPLTEEMAAGWVRTLAILGGNPVYTAPADVPFAALLRRVPRTLYFGLHHNETARACGWLVPAAHGLESWGDARAYDGTASLVQPLIAPLYQGRTEAEVLALLLGETRPNAYALLRGFWRERAGAADFETWWETALQRGVVAPRSSLSPLVGPPFPRPLPPEGGKGRTAEAPGSAPPLPLAGRGGRGERGPDARRGARGERGSGAAIGEPAGSGAPGGSDHALEVIFRQDASLYDGRFAGNAWLQELPDPLTKLAWENAAIVSPATALRLGLESGDRVELAYRGHTLEAPVLALPGHADDSVSLPLGYGRQGSGTVAGGAGFDAYRLRTADAPYFGAGLRIRKLDGHHDFASTQTHWTMEGRPIVLTATLDEYRRDPHFAREQQGPTLSLYQPWEYTGDQWAMSIDLSVCTGCSACVVACQAENNIPVVGREGVLKRREMHWLRIDRYFSGEPDDPQILHQPMLCQHCEKAPCEYVCPVNATVHSPDGLNEMVYNRCVGTRFCSNNCPYKVRRFNWFDYNDDVPETEKMGKNPDVTVRARGVMEKCTYCVQRIREAQIRAQVEGVPIADGEIQTACQQACPTRAIVFGSLGDPASAVTRLRQEPRSYSVLHELGTEPRTRYLARITNPNPALG